MAMVLTQNLEAAQRFPKEIVHTTNLLVLRVACEKCRQRSQSELKEEKYAGRMCLHLAIGSVDFSET